MADPCDAMTAPPGFRRTFPIRFAAVAALMLTACATAQPPRTAHAWKEAAQVVIVTTADWDSDRGTLHRFERTPGEDGRHRWAAVGEAAPVTVGRAGIAWGIGLHPDQRFGPRKLEGDGRAPAGVFSIGSAFGYGPDASTALPYRGMTAGDYCIDVPASPLYNRIVDVREADEQAVAGSTEPMRRDLHADGDLRYRLGFLIEHNPRAVPGSGSCIFAHLWKAPGVPTSGCTAMAAPVMERLLGWLDPSRQPVFVLLPAAEYRRLRDDWDLPHLPPAGH